MAQMVERVSQASQEAIEGGESYAPTHDDINNLYFVGGSKKNAFYGLGSHAKFLFDMSIPRLKGGSSFSYAQVEALRKENEELRQEFGALKQNIKAQVNEKVEERVLILKQNMEERINEIVEERVNILLADRVNTTVEQSMQAFMTHFMPSQPLMSHCFPIPHSLLLKKPKILIKDPSLLLLQC